MLVSTTLKIKDIYSSQIVNRATKILLVEDHIVNLQLLTEYLSFSDYEVFPLAKGSEFFETISQFQPDVILLDLKLPDIDGYTLLEQMQQNLQWQHIPIIVISAFAFKSDQERALNLGARQYLVKPVSLSHLKEVIEAEVQQVVI